MTEDEFRHGMMYVEAIEAQVNKILGHVAEGRYGRDEFLSVTLTAMHGALNRAKSIIGLRQYPDPSVLEKLSRSIYEAVRHGRYDSRSTVGDAGLLIDANLKTWRENFEEALQSRS